MDLSQDRLLLELEIRELLGVVIYIRFAPSYKREGHVINSRVTRVEAGSNTSTLALRVIGGDEKGILE
jgi:hypothetical protein